MVLFVSLASHLFICPWASHSTSWVSQLCRSELMEVVVVEREYGHRSDQEKWWCWGVLSASELPPWAHCEGTAPLHQNERKIASLLAEQSWFFGCTCSKWNISQGFTAQNSSMPGRVACIAQLMCISWLGTNLSACSSLIASEDLQ